MAVLTAIKKLFGYPATMGGKVGTVCYINGPVSYSGGATGGQLIYDVGARSIDHLSGAMSVSGNYMVVGQPNSAGPNSQASGAGKPFRLRWFHIATGVPTEAGNATNLSAETVQFFMVEG